jgi:hypothetical protein
MVNYLCSQILRERGNGINDLLKETGNAKKTCTNKTNTIEPCPKGEIVYKK